MTSNVRFSAFNETNSVKNTKIERLWRRSRAIAFLLTLTLTNTYHENFVTQLPSLNLVILQYYQQSLVHCRSSTTPFLAGFRHHLGVQTATGGPRSARTALRKTRFICNLIPSTMIYSTTVFGMENNSAQKQERKKKPRNPRFHNLELTLFHSSAD